MCVERNVLRSFAVLTALAAFLVPHAARAVSYEIVSVSATRIQVRYNLNNKEISSVANLQPVLFAFSSAASLSASITIYPEAKDQTKTPTPGRAIPFSMLSKGWAGQSFLQWFAFSPFYGGPGDGRIAVSRGLIIIDFGSSVIKPLEKSWVQNGILHMGISSGLKKTAQLQKPILPFTAGLRMFVDKDGIYQLSALELRRLGVPVDRIQSRYFKIFNAASEVPLYITNTQRPVLGNDDVILFYATGLRGKSSYYAQFSNSNAYWLTWQSDRPGIRIAEASGAKRKDLTVYQGTGSRSISAREFLDTIHLEQDNEILSLGNVNVAQDMADSLLTRDFDNWYWGPIGKNALTDFTINVPPPSLSTDASKTARLHIRLQGVTSDPTVSPDHRLAIYLNGDTLGYAAWDGQTSFDFISSSILSSRLSPGANTITFATQSTLSHSDQSELNWIEIEYYRSFTALDDMIQFANNSLDTNGIYQFSIKGFTLPQLDLWDLTMHRLYSGFETSPDAQKGASPLTLVFQDSLESVHRFIAQTTAKRMLPLDMAIDTIRTNWDEVATAEYIIVTPDSFAREFAPFADVYKKKGMAVAVVDISDVYNTFSYGIRDPESIRTMLGYLFSLPSAKPPRYLLLGGDTSHDLDKKNRTRNIVPTHLSLVPGWGPASDDGYFATVVGDDDFPDLYVGRFPAENRLGMKSLVTKTVNYLTAQTKGPWHDNLLMLGGAESDFTTFNDQTITEIIGPALNIVRLDGDPASRYYRDAAVASKDIAGYINAGLFAINFNGHGGGLVWSDSKFFSFSDLDKLYNGQWDKAGRLPLVFSFTCLTGFFESPDYRSLGEEMVRLPQNGAIGFFGASAYTSKNGNCIMDRVFLDNAINGRFESVGELLWLSKINMLVRFGSEYVPLVRQYNFLGDPALPWSLPPDSLRLSLMKQALGARDTLTVKGTCGGNGGDGTQVSQGQVKITVGADFRKWNDYVWNVTAGSFTGACILKDSLKSSRGFVHAYAWNDSAEMRGWTSFSRNTLLFKNVSIVPSAPHYGDSVRISAIINTPDTLLQQVNALFCLYAVAPRSVRAPVFQGVSMVRDSSGTWTTAGEIPLAFHGTIGEELLCKFREVGIGVSDTTDTYAFPILGRPDLNFTAAGPQLLFYNDSLFIHCEVINSGTTTSPPFSVSFFKDTIQASPAFYSFVSRDSLFPGKTRQLYFSIPDTQGNLTFSCIINPQAAFEEINRDNNTARLQLNLAYADMQDVNDSLHSQKKGVSLAPCVRLGARHRVFLFSDTIAAVQPLRTESRWTPLAGDSIKRFWTGIRPALAQGDSLVWIFRRSAADSASLSKEAALSSQAKLCICLYDPAILAWRYVVSNADTGKTTCIMHSRDNGPFALSRLSDTRPPQIRSSVDGREVMFLDYAAKGRPFNLFLSDASGVIPSSVKVVLNKRTLDSGLVSKTALQSDLREFSMTAYPKKEYAVDSLSVSAQDLAGNNATTVFAYMPGEDLAIKTFSCHPNPFTAKQDNNGATVQTIRFAFLLTDVAKEARIVIYTIANRVVWTWQKTNGIIGYQEVPWDGKTSQGQRIANGTYYAKLSVKNDSKKATSIIRIAKLEGF
jgi:hypothetical protein